jgi:RNase P/RNase MRP subunit POP5
MKPLKPSIREKKRYLLIRGKNLKENVFRAVKDFIGVLGMSEASIQVIKFGGDWMIISVNRKSLDKIRASLVVWPEKMEVEKVSGTLKGLGKR